MQITDVRVRKVDKEGKIDKIQIKKIKKGIIVCIRMSYVGRQI